MRLVKKIALGFVALLALGVTAFAMIISHDSPCEPAPPVAGDAARMHAIVHRCYGGPESLSYEEVARPVANDDQVLVKVHAAAVNPYDWHMMTGKPYFMRLGTGLGTPDRTRAGMDFAGTVEAVGRNVTRFRPGDEVFGGAGGAFAEYVVANANGSIAHKPPGVSFDEAAALPIAGVTALQALRDMGRLEAGQRVLINGASGGVGTFAVQLAKSMGAQVTGVCSARNVEMVRSLGADHVVDYTREDFTQLAERYDLIVDNVGNHSFRRLRNALVPGGTLVLVGGPKGAWIDPLMPIIKGAIVAPFVDEKFVFFVARLVPEDLALLAEHADAGRLRSEIGRHYALNEVPAALEYIGGRHAQGKIIVRLE